MICKSNLPYPWGQCWREGRESGELDAECGGGGGAGGAKHETCRRGKGPKVGL